MPNAANNAAMEPIDALNDRVKAVVLDLDGTLYDKRRLAARLIASQLLFLPLLAAEQRTRKALKGQFFGSEADFYTNFFRKMAKKRLFSVRLARWWYFRCYMPAMVRVLRRAYRPQAWVQPFIEACRQRKIAVAVYSDYGCVAEKLHALGFAPQQFDFVVSAPELGGLKPSAQAAAQVVERLQVASADCLFVGDRNDTDGASARTVGAQFFLIENDKNSIK